MSRYWHRARRFLAQKVLHTSDTPHAIALGTGIAVTVAFLPLIGLQTVIAVALAALFRANKAICVPLVWITNPFTAVPIYGACFGLGRVVLAAGPGSRDEAAILSALEQHHAASFFELAFWQNLLSRFVGYGKELWVGCAIVGLLIGILSYLGARWGVSVYREHRRKRILRRSLFRSRLAQGKVTRRSGVV